MNMEKQKLPQSPTYDTVDQSKSNTEIVDNTEFIVDNRESKNYRGYEGYKQFKRFISDPNQYKELGEVLDIYINPYRIRQMLRDKRLMCENNDEYIYSYEHKHNESISTRIPKAYLELQGDEKGYLNIELTFPEEEQEEEQGKFLSVLDAEKINYILHSETDSEGNHNLVNVLDHYGYHEDNSDYKILMERSMDYQFNNDYGNTLKIIQYFDRHGNQKSVKYELGSESRYDLKIINLEQNTK